MLVGISTGANVVAALELARGIYESGLEGVVVTIACDGADKYLSEHFWNDQN
jgi:cysteine synthase B